MKIAGLKVAVVGGDDSGPVAAGGKGYQSVVLEVPALVGLVIGHPVQDLG